MSVLKNKRSESQLEFYHTATIIRADLTRFVMNEKIVPKRWRPVFTFPMVEKIIKLIDYITAANTIYPQNLREAELRWDYQTRAIITVEQIIQLLQYILTTMPVNPDKFQPVTELLTKAENVPGEYHQAAAAVEKICRKSGRRGNVRGGRGGGIRVMERLRPA